MAEHLVEIDRKDFPELHQLFKLIGSKSYIGYTTLKNPYDLCLCEDKWGRINDLLDSRGLSCDFDSITLDT